MSNYETGIQNPAEADQPLSEIRLAMNTQTNALQAINDTLGVLFTRLAPMLTAETPSVKQPIADGGKSDHGKELMNNNEKLWAINGGLHDLLDRLQF